MAGFDDLGAESPQPGGANDPTRLRRFDADAASRTTNENADHHSEQRGEPHSGWYSATGGGAGGSGSDHNDGGGTGGSTGGSNNNTGGPGQPRGAGRSSRGRPKRRRWPWIVGGTAAAIAVAAFVLAPTVIDWLSVSVDEVDREIAIDGDAASSVVVPAGWVLEQRPFAEELVMYTPDGAVAICLSTPEETNGTTAEVLAQRLANEQDWGGTTFSVEHAPSGALVVHALRPASTSSNTKQTGEDASGSADSQARDEQAAETEAQDIPEATNANEADAEAEASQAPAVTPCADKPVVMLAAITQDSSAPVAVRIGSDGDVSPYFGEIASILSGVTAS